MEFYTTRAWSEGVLSVGFNSQRDGILRIWTRRSVGRINIVSIPNGMEFYENLGLLIQRYKLVSIPNGMEFYGLFFLCRKRAIPFQFPTGWNSTQKSTQNATQAHVSIPNGMEFYDGSSS